MRSVVAGLAPETLAALPGVTVIGPLGAGVEIETEIETGRYRDFTRTAKAIAASGGDFVEIAGNDDILVTVISPDAADLGALAVIARQGRSDYRQLLDLKVTGLATALRGFATGPVAIEHIHDY